jgi:hypothetical protein
VPLSIALNYIRATHPYPITTTVTLDAEQAARVLAWYNAQPPASALHFDLIVMVKHRNNTLALLLGSDGMICRIEVVPPEDVERLMRVIAGDRA